MSLPPTDWLPTYPDVVEPLPEPITESFYWAPFSSQAYPVADVLADLTFFPTYPDRVPDPDVPRPQYEFAVPPVVEAALAPVAWLPQYPDRVPPAELEPAAHPFLFEPPPGYFLAVAASMAWSPSYPSEVPPLSEQEQAGGFLVSPSIVAGGQVCVLVDDVDVTRPAIIGEVLTLSDIVDEIVTTPRILEELC